MDNDDKDQPAAAEIELGQYSVQWFEAAPGPCTGCGERVGSGPVGFQADAGLLCDSCLLERNMDLGMLLIMVNVNREFASLPKPDDPSEKDLRKTALMTFSMMYDQAATWPRRRRALLGFLRDLVKRFAQVPLEAVIKMMEGDAH